MIKLHDLHTDNLIKKRKQINRNTCSIGEATVSECFLMNKIVNVTDACAV